MTISVRDARRDEWPDVLKIHRRAIHETAAVDYPKEVLNAWGSPLNDDDAPRTLAEFDAKLERGQIVLVAEINGRLAGFGELKPEQNELVALYVNPDFGRQGVGSAILRELERIAREHTLPCLHMDASLTAVQFYEAHGFRALGQGTHRLRNGTYMACVNMRKNLL